MYREFASQQLQIAASVEVTEAFTNEEEGKDRGEDSRR